MTSQVPAAPPHARLTLAAIGLACCLAVYVIAVPLMLRNGAVGWRLALAVTAAGAASAGVLTALWLLRDTLAGTRRQLASTLEELARKTARTTQLERDAEQQAERARQQADEITALADEITMLKDEAFGLRDEIATFKDEVTALRNESAAGRERAERLETECTQLRKQAEAAASEHADQRDSARSAVAAMSRRVQASAHRIQEEASLMAERHPRNADVLEVSMRVDHAAAQQARTAQSMAVLLGEWPGQQWQDPLPLVDVVRAAAGRIIAYRRIEVVGDPDIAASAPIVEPLIHLVAELLANATQSSPPSTQVPVTIRVVQRGAVIEVHDCGIGLDDYRLAQARAIATGEEPVGLEGLGECPRTGLAVVGQYVRRHGFRLDISESVYGGVRAIVGVPIELTETVRSAESMPVEMTDPMATVAPPAPPATAPPTTASPSASATTAGTTTTTTATTAEAVADAPAVTRRRGLPRRVSPRHAAAADGGDADAAVRGGPADAPAPPTPQEAGEWMGSFLTSTAPDGDSANPTGQQEQE